MFPMPVRKRKNGKVHVYWALVESFRTPKGSRHRLVGWLGELQGGAEAGWAELCRRLNGKLPAMPQPTLFGPEPPREPVPDQVKIDVRGVRVEPGKDFGDLWLGLVLWRMLELDTLLGKLLPPGHEGVPWPLLVTIEVLNRFAAPSSELHAADTWYAKTALPELLGVPAEAVYDERLYRTLDVLLPHKDAVERHLAAQFGALFGLDRDLCFYDVTSSYFEGEAARNPLAQRGHSRDGKSGCKQVCIGLVAGADGMPRGHEVFAGNRHDGPTLPGRVDHMEAHYGPARRLWVFDRGIADEGNLAYIKGRGGVYLVGTPRPLLRRFEAELADPDGWRPLANGLRVKLLPGSGEEDTYVLCRSEERAGKERAMHERFAQRIEAGLLRLAGRLAAAKKHPDRARTDRQLGRLLQRNSRAAGKFAVRLEDDPDRPGHLRLAWTLDEAWDRWAALSEGAYLLRTPLADRDPEALWRRYMKLTEVEDVFRTLKTDLLLRPFHHQVAPRVRAHIFVSYLALVLWKTLERLTEAAGLGTAARTVREECARIKLNAVILPTSTGREIQLQCVNRPDARQRALLDRLGIKIPERLGEPRWRKVIEL
jgi:Transposase DDE domain